MRLPSASLFLFRRSELSCAVCSSQSLDHVVPRARLGRNSYRNLVSSCIKCNSQKGEKAADDFLHWLHRKGQLNASELAGRLRALDDLASGKLRPPLAIDK